METETEQKPELTPMELSSDFFLLGMQIRTGHLELPGCEPFKRRVLQLFESMKNKALRAGLLHNDVEDARYALAAYLDEMIQYSEWPGRHEWGARPLQAILFGESQAGVRFFDRLREVRKRSREVLEIYYLCLVLGFMGHYQLGGPQELDSLIDDLRHELGQESTKILAPHGKSPEVSHHGRKALPFLPLAGGVIFLTIVIILFLYLSVASHRSDGVEFLQQFLRS